MVQEDPRNAEDPPRQSEAGSWGSKRVQYPCPRRIPRFHRFRPSSHDGASGGEVVLEEGRGKLEPLLRGAGSQDTPVRKGVSGDRMMAETRMNAMIPKERIGVLVGPKGSVKSTIEQKLFVDLKIDSESGSVDIGVKPDSPDPSYALRAKDMVLAIGRGFSPPRAFSLFNDDYTFEMVDLHDYFGKNEAEIRRVDGRIIGREGRARRNIEELTGTLISVSGHTISIIGTFEAVSMAKDALEKLIEGRQHGTVYKILKKRRRKVKKEKALGLWEGSEPTKKKA